MPLRSRAVKRIPLDDTFTQSQDSTPSQGRRRSARHHRPDQHVEPAAQVVPAKGDTIETVKEAPVKTIAIVSESLKETYETIPDQLEVFAPVSHGEKPFTAEESAALYQQAEGFLVDSRAKGPFGDIAELDRIGKRKRGPEGDPKEALLDRLDRGPLWFNARLAFLRTGEVEIYNKAWSPFIPPPLIASLFPLPPQPRSHFPTVGTDIPLWSVNPTSDLDPELDSLPSFEHEWEAADGNGWGMRSADVYGSASATGSAHQQDNSNWSLDCDDVDTRAVSPVGTGQMPATVDNFVPTTAQGSFTRLPPDAIDVHAGLALTAPGLATRHTKISRASADLACVGSITAPPGPPTNEADWDKQAKLRKQWWRNECAKDGHGQVWDIITRPHTLVPKFPKKSRTSVRPPDYNLPRYFKTVHPNAPDQFRPFHPDLRTYAEQNPCLRVYWTIPISGSVVVPGFFDPTSPVPPSSKAPLPSPAVIVSSLAEVTSPIYGVRPIIWTPQLIEHLWDAFLVPLHEDDARPFGLLSVMISGPKPDPFIALKAAPPLDLWVADENAGSSEVNEAARENRPVRPEMGDHIRLYCPLKYALSLRTWINGIEVNLNALSAPPVEPNSRTAKGVRKKLYRVFDKARLVLVGPRGEALIVA